MLSASPPIPATHSISANGQQPAANHAFNFFRFCGDLNGDRRVELANFGQFGVRFFTSLP